MTSVAEVEHPGPAATDGEIAAINLESACRGAWARFAQDPRLPGVAEEIVDSERLASQFLGDLDVLDRLDLLASKFARADDSSRAPLVQAEVASAAHRFDDARGYLARAARTGAPREAIERQALAIDQACGVELDAVLAARRGFAKASGRLEDLVPLGALLADLERFAEADTVYRQAFFSYDDVSPFPLAWVCFQLGMLWGELAACAGSGSCRDLVSSRDRLLAGLCEGACAPGGDLREPRPHGRRGGVALAGAFEPRSEVNWRLADVLTAQGRFEEGERQLDAARSGFDQLLGRHLLAFADHAAEFYAGSGNDRRRALELARTNVANRPDAPCRQAGRGNCVDCRCGWGQAIRTKPAGPERPV
jgi:tetratricopeptide (TPR) repeat protein